MQETRPVRTSSGTPVRHSSGTSEPAQKPEPLDLLREALRSCHYSRRTDEEKRHCSYQVWIKTKQSGRNNCVGVGRIKLSCKNRQLGFPYYTDPKMLR